jgi:hypothetical protein
MSRLLAGALVTEGRLKKAPVQRPARLTLNRRRFRNAPRRHEGETGQSL